MFRESVRCGYLCIFKNYCFLQRFCCFTELFVILHPKSTFTWNPKLTQNILRFHVPAGKNLMLVWSELKTDAHRKKFSGNMHARNWRKWNFPQISSRLKSNEAMSYVVWLLWGCHVNILTILQIGPEPFDTPFILTFNWISVRLKKENM